MPSNVYRLEATTAPLPGDRAADGQALLGIATDRGVGSQRIAPRQALTRPAGASSNSLRAGSVDLTPLVDVSQLTGDLIGESFRTADGRNLTNRNGGSDKAFSFSQEPDEHNRVGAGPSKGQGHLTGKKLVPMGHEVPGCYSHHKCSRDNRIVFAVQCLD